MLHSVTLPSELLTCLNTSVTQYTALCLLVLIPIPVHDLQSRADGAWKERKNGAIYAGGTKAFSKDEVARCENIFRMYDVDRSGGVDFPEFCVLFTVLRFPTVFTEPQAMQEFVKFDIDQDAMLNEDEFLRLVTRELCRKTVIRRQELYGLLERGIDGGRRLQEEKEAALRGETLDDMDPNVTHHCLHATGSLTPMCPLYLKMCCLCCSSLCFNPNGTRLSSTVTLSLPW